MVVLSIMFFLVGCAIVVFLATSYTYFTENSKPNQKNLAEFYFNFHGFKAELLSNIYIAVSAILIFISTILAIFFFISAFK